MRVMCARTGLWEPRVGNCPGRPCQILACTVRDAGIGIPKEDQKKIFGKLYRASNVQTIDGNGFGLYVAKGAIEQQGGRIWFESQVGKGTTFYVEVPI